MRAHRTVRPPDAFDGRILVPFSPESLLSGVGRQLQPDELLWYVRRVPVPALGEGERCLLHFEAVDFACACCVNGQVVGTHEGGYLPFSFDITEALRAEKAAGEGSTEARFQGAEAAIEDVAVEGIGDAKGGACGEGKDDLEEAADLAPAPPREFVVALCVRDPSDAGTQPRGKQRLKSGGIWYTAQSGIWQPVWMEVVPARRVLALALHPDADAGTLTADVDVSGDAGLVRIYVCDPTAARWPPAPLSPKRARCRWARRLLNRRGRPAAYACGSISARCAAGAPTTRVFTTSPCASAPMSCAATPPSAR